MARVIENRTFDELQVGETLNVARHLTPRDAQLLAVLSGLPDCGAWAGPVMALLVGAQFPGPGTLPLGLELNFAVPVAPGDAIEIRLTVREKRALDVVVLDCLATDCRGELAFSGILTVRAPTQKVRLSCGEAPDIRVNDHVRHQQLIDRCKALAPAVTAVVHPCDGPSLRAALEAAAAGLIAPILVGPEHKIRAVAAAEALDISTFPLVAVPHSHAAADAAVALARAGQAEALMKGSLHTDELMHAVVAPDCGLRTERRISHVYLFDVADYPRPLLITDAAINIAPSLAEKADICRNAIDLAHTIGIETPKLAILSAVETVSARMPSTLDAAALCKMADRGQIAGAVLDGPLAFDNAISPQAAHTKNIVSAVAGQADILLVPDLESGNMLAKQLTYFGGADGAGIVLGARVPIILTSRADPPGTRLASCAIACLVANARRPVEADQRSPVPSRPTSI
ncbi:MAG: bifunctional enoyl-CoA hydratase/phosphate acetyltransferase [Alphaproteobacteria bacterium]|nr:bifunctional enoyl-CoA hydratase/phosphate acetyltransferase [Alphaproteobacteria bacterium]